MLPRRGFVIALASVALAVTSRSHAAETISIGTAGVMGVYYPLGGAICRMVNVTRKEHKLRCTVEASEGSVANIRNVLARKVDVGIAQSDMQHAATMGEGPFRDGAQPKLRALFSVYPELLTVMTREDANVRTLTDLRGKRVSLGPPGSGTRATMELVLDAVGVDKSDLKAALGLKFVEMSPALCENKIDAFAFVAGHPNPVFHEAADSCKTRIIAIEGGAVDNLLKNKPYYVKAEVPGRLYKGTEAPQSTFGTVASVVVSDDMPEATAYALTRAVFENFEDFQKLHPALGGLTREQAAKGAPVPFHAGAVRYFKEAGLM
jgi:TRAP transporter TAXI family solute receptor